MPSLNIKRRSLLNGVFLYRDQEVRWIFTLFFNPQQMASNPHESQMEWM